MQVLTGVPTNSPALILNADYRPLSYFPLSLWSWEEVVKAVWQDRVDVVATYDHVVRSPSMEMQLPSVVCLKSYINQDLNPAFSRINVFLRDSFRCQYCGELGTSHDLTFDHVMPRSQGGVTSWKNIVTACGPCNLRKGGRTPLQAQMPLRRKVERPSTWQLQQAGRRFPPATVHKSWLDYLYWDLELEP